jgi:hypothetical protein
VTLVVLMALSDGCQESFVTLVMVMTISDGCQEPAKLLKLFLFL